MPSKLIGSALCKFLNRSSVRGALAAQCVKHWPTDLAVRSASPTRGEIFLVVNGAPLHTAFHYQPTIKFSKE